ncbi:MAG: 3-hydroxybutyryl-CoA dehydrogenase [Egibacteraceae bacterium]
MERIGVVGGGQMGAGIAEVCLRHGLEVVVREIDEPTAERARQRIEGSLEKGVSRGKLSADERDAALDRLRATAHLEDLADRTLVIEAIVEQQEAKQELFARLDEVLESPDAVLASNTSSIPIMRIAAATTRPESVIGIHFFNPVPVLKLVELVPCLETSDATRKRAEAFAETLGKQPISCTDRAGFVVNALLIPYLLSAIRMVEAGVATAEDIDTGMVSGCAHPMGPLALNDLVGLDVTKAVAESLYAEFAEPLYAPPPLLSRMVEAGHLGRKTGRGFYRYE